MNERILATIETEDFIGRSGDSDAIRQHAEGNSAANGLWLLAAPALGASELLKQIYDRFSHEQRELIPVYLLKKYYNQRIMGLAKLKTKISVEDYLAGEETCSVRYEYIYGEVYAMAGASDNHNRIAINLTTLLSIHLRGSPCEPFSGDIKVRVSPHVYYYPDVLVSCEENPENPHFRNDPILIVEVLSTSTQEIDRREKLLFYQQMPSVLEYVVIEQQKKLVEVHRRQTDGRWITYYFNQDDESVEFQSVKLTMPLDEIYRRVKFET